MDYKLPSQKSQVSPIVWDSRAQIWRIGRVSIFPTCPRFLRWSAIIPDKLTLTFVSSGTSVMDFGHYQSSKLLGSSPLITHLCTSFNFWRTIHFPPNSISGEPGIACEQQTHFRSSFLSLRKIGLNLGQTSGNLSDISAKSWTVGKK